MIKKVIYSLTLLSSMFFIFSSCDDDENTAVNADFTLAVSGQSPNAEVTITNTTTGASSYMWTFSEGAEMETSTEQNPGTITVDKTGTFEVTLVASRGNDTETITKTIEITGEDAIIVYQDIAFARAAANATYGRFFSTETGLIYKDSEVNATTGSKIDLAFATLGESVNYFTSPDDEEEDFNIPSAQTTKVVNYTPDFGITSAIFDAATNDAFIDDITISASDDDSFGTSHPYIILFETESGRKGAIKTKAVNADRLLVDIKVQKY
jgi:PKD repeat protein